MRINELKEQIPQLGFHPLTTSVSQPHSIFRRSESDELKADIDIVYYDSVGHCDIVLTIEQNTYVNNVDLWLRSELMKTNGFHDLQRVEDIADETIIRLLELIKRYLETPINQRVAQRFYRVKKSLRGRQLPGISFSRARYLEADLITTFRDDWDVAQHLFDVVSPDTTDNVTLTAKTLTAKQLLQAVDQHIQSAKYDVVNSVGRDGTIEI